MGWAILFEVRIARTRSGYENCRGFVTREGEVGRVSGFCIERALRKHARPSVIGLAAISKMPFARDNHCKPIVAVGMRRDVSMRRYLKLDGIRASRKRPRRRGDRMVSLIRKRTSALGPMAASPFRRGHVES
jgi:hypothetical protein